jgi:hypothetical protein
LKAGFACFSLHYYAPLALTFGGRLNSSGSIWRIALKSTWFSVDGEVSAKVFVKIELRSLNKAFQHAVFHSVKHSIFAALRQGS